MLCGFREQILNCLPEPAWRLSTKFAPLPLKVLQMAAKLVCTTCDWLLRGMLRSEWFQKSADVLTELMEYFQDTRVSFIKTQYFSSILE